MESNTSERPRLNLKPRNEAAARAEEERRRLELERKGNPFGAARPREAILADRTGKSEEELLAEEAKQKPLNLRLNAAQLEEKRAAEAAVAETREALEKEEVEARRAELRRQLSDSEAALEDLMRRFEQHTLEKVEKGEIARQSELRARQQQQALQIPPPPAPYGGRGGGAAAAGAGGAYSPSSGAPGGFSSGRGGGRGFGGGGSGGFNQNYNQGYGAGGGGGGFGGRGRGGGGRGYRQYDAAGGPYDAGAAAIPDEDFSAFGAEGGRGAGGYNNGGRGRGFGGGRGRGRGNYGQPPGAPGDYPAPPVRTYSGGGGDAGGRGFFDSFNSKNRDGGSNNYVDYQSPASTFKQDRF